eukprot:scaffold11388_cov185-Skeletonema_marinoi.AAC.2
MSSSGKGSLSYGLNNKKRKKGGLTGFADDSSSSDDDAAAGKTGPLSGRSAMNREIAAEQAALRKRAEAAMASSSKMDSAVFDYDGEYDSFASGNKKETKTQQREPAGKGQSRYVSNLLQSAQRRSQEQEIIYERKVVKEQAEEKEFEGKEKFITSAYKKKLAEREAWAKEEEERAKREAEDDVINKKGGSFLYGFSRNVLMGVNDNKKDDKSTSNVAHKDDALDTASGRKEESTYADQQSYQHREYSRQTENPALPRQRGGANNFSRNSQPSEGIGNTKAADETKQPLTRSQILAERAVKIREARERYFKRQGLPNQ